MAAGPTRVIPLTVLSDADTARQRYLALGFVPVDVPIPDCHVLRAGDSYAALVSVEGLARSFKPSTVAELAGTTVPYVYVSSIDAAKLSLASDAVVMDEATTDRGTRELVVKVSGERMILAQQLHQVSP
jgi:hypothetical protein